MPVNKINLPSVCRRHIPNILVRYPVPYHHGMDVYRYLLADLNDGTVSYTLGYRDVDPGSRRAKSMEIHADTNRYRYPRLIPRQPGIRIRIRINLSCWIRIRIHIADPDPDPGGQKLSTKIEKSTEFSCFEVLDVLFWGLKASPVTWASFIEA